MFTIRAAKLTDAHAIARIHVDTWRAAYRGQISDAVLEAQTVEWREEFWRGRLAQQNGSVFVVESDGVIGFCDLIPSRDKGVNRNTVGEIAAIYIAAAYWRRGAGQALGYHVLAQARARGYQAVTLWVLASNSDAMRFYETLGFARDGGIKIETASDGSTLHELRFRKTLVKPDSKSPG